MRPDFIAFCLMLVFGSCESSNPPVRIKDSTSIQLKTKFNSIIHGDWVQASYINDIAKTKSPLQSQSTLTSVVELNIDTTQIEGDSLIVGAPSIHEGTSFYLYYRNGQNESSLPTNNWEYDSVITYTELGYQFIKKDTFLFLRFFGSGNKLIREVQYLKSAKATESAMEFMVNKTLISGLYHFTDSSGELKAVRFSDRGIVTGFPVFSKYYVLTDFVANEDNSPDEICFDLNTKNQTCCPFEIIGDTIKLYEPVGPENTDSVKIRKLKYLLLKQ